MTGNRPVQSKFKSQSQSQSQCQYVGQDLPMDDARAKAAGRMVFTSDMRFHGMRHAKLLLSPLPHARIVSIDTAKALALPGVCQVFTHENTPDRAYNAQVWYSGQKAAVEDERLFSPVVQYVGDRVAAVVADTEETAQKALDLIDVEYEPLAACLDPEAALDRKGQPFAVNSLSCGDVDQAFASAHLVVEDRVETPRTHHGAMENHVCVAICDHNDKITIYSPCQILFSVRLIVSRLLDMPMSRVRVIKSAMGGSFGGKQEVILEALCAFFAQQIQGTVKIEFNRTQSIVASRTRTRVIGKIKTAVSREGKILGREVETLVDTGAYTSNGAILGMAMGKKLFRLYRIPNQRYQSASVHTNAPVAGAFRGYGSPQGHAMTEINMDNVARALDMDPVALRLKNLVHPNDPDPTGAPDLGNARIIDCVTQGAQAFDWASRRARPTGTGRFRHGVGMAAATHINGYYGAYHEFTTMCLKMAEDGSLILNSGLHELGCGTIMSVKQIIAEVMGVPPERIEAPEGDSETAPFDSGSQASRVTYVCGGCAMKTAQALKTLFKKEAALILDCPMDDVIMENETVWPRPRPQDKMGYGQMASLIQVRNQKELIVLEQFTPEANPGSYGANFAAVQVDTLTGRVRVQEVVAVHDVGRAVNPGFVRGQIYGGIQMGLGFALTEDIDVDPETGRSKGDRFSRYHLVNAPDMPEIKVLLVEEGESTGPFGAKSIGEIATIPIAPAVVNAVNHALGTRLTHLPLTPERIVAALHSH